MRIGIGLTAVAALALAAGCRVLHEAHEAQRAVAEKAAGESAAEARADLSDATLADLVEYACAHRPTVVEARLAVEDARLALKALDASAPIVSGTPWTSASVSASGGYDASSRTARRPDGLSSRTTGAASGALSLDVLIWDFGRYDANARAAAEDLLAAEMRLLSAGYAVFEDVSGTYFSLLEQDALLEVACTNRAEYACHLERATRNLELGEGKPLDVTRAKLDLAMACERLVAASNAVATAGAEFMRALGVSVGEGTRETVFPARPGALAQVMRGFADTATTVDETFALARTNAPAMTVARARLRAASARVDYAVADLMPQVSATASLGWADPLWVWRWGVGASQSLFSGFSRVTAVRRAINAMRQAETQVDGAEQELSRDLSVAVAARDNAVQAAASAAVSVKAGRENLDLVTQRFAAGEVDRVEYTDAVADYVRALGDRVSAYYAGQRAESRLFALTGAMPRYNERSEEMR